MLSRDSVINLLKIISKDSRLNNIQMGLFGSFARNEAKDNSDIDIVLKGENTLYLVCDGIEDIVHMYIDENLGLKCDVVDYADLENDYEEAKELGIEEFTLKTAIDREVIWIGR